MGKVLFKTPYLELKSTLGANGKGEWIYAHRPNVSGIVIIVPLIMDSKILFLKTRRLALLAEGYNGFNIELPAGLVGDEVAYETIEAAACKELLEETGLKACSIEFLTQSLSSSGGCTSEVSTLVLAHITDETLHICPQSDNGVIVERVQVELTNVFAWLEDMEKEGNTIGAQTLSGLFYVFNRGINK